MTQTKLHFLFLIIVFNMVSLSFFYFIEYELEKVLAQSSKTDENGFQLTKVWTPISPDKEYITPTDLAIDSSSEAYVLDGDASHVYKFDSNGNFITKWGSYGDAYNGEGKDGQFEGPKSLAVDSFDNIYVLDSGNYRIQKFDSDGNFITKWGSPGSGDKQFSDPTEITIDPKNNVYISDSGNNRIQKFDTDGNLLAKWGKKGYNDGEFRVLAGITTDSTGDVYTTESGQGYMTGNGRVQKFDSNGNFITKWTLVEDDREYKNPHGIGTDPEDRIYIGESDYVYLYDLGTGNNIQKFDQNGTFITKVKLENMDEPWNSFKIDSIGNIYTMNIMDNNIQIFKPAPDDFDTKEKEVDVPKSPISENKTNTEEDNPSITEQPAGITDYV